MNTAIYIYLYIVFGNIVNASVSIAISGFVMACLYHFFACEIAEGEDKLLPHIKLHAFFIKSFFVITILLSAFYPTKDDLKFIIGWYVVSEATEIKGVKELPENIVSAINTFLENIDSTEKK